MGLYILEHYTNGLILFGQKEFKDNRGSFIESYRKDEFLNLLLPSDFVQDNMSVSEKGVIRGLHFQFNKPQGKLIRVISGSAFTVEVDIRPKSHTYGNWFAFNLSAENKNVLWVPPGFANGFQALESSTRVYYKCTELYNPSGEASLNYSDPAIGIAWPIDNPILSQKDLSAPSFAELSKQLNLI